MLGNFSYYNPVKCYFGDGALDLLGGELAKYGDVVMISYGGGSIKKNGVYDEVVAALEAAGKTVIDDGGVMPNPTRARVDEGIAKVRDNNVGLILAVGGGSVCDYTKAVSTGANIDCDWWDKYFVNREKADDVDCVPIGVVLTMVGTGSEMNTTSVVTDEPAKFKRDTSFGENAFPKFAVLKPSYTMTLPKYQMVAGAYDIMCHIMEQYFSNDDDNTTDYIAEGMMRAVVAAARESVKDPQNYEARSNLMWSATWGLNGLLKCGKVTDWRVHMIGHAISAVTNATHGMTLASVSIPYYKMVLAHGGVAKFKRFAETVFNVDACCKSDMEVAEAGLAALEAWMREIGVVMNCGELGVTEENIPEILKAIIFYDGAGYYDITEDDAVAIIKESMTM